MAKKTINKKTKTKSLDDVRKRINTLDDKVHDLLMERTALVSEVIAAKKSQNLPSLDPAREANLIHRIIENHKGDFPPLTLIRIWREIIGGLSILQTDIRVSIAGVENLTLREMARDYFGTNVPLTDCSNAIQAITNVRNKREMFAVVPAIATATEVNTDTKPWWVYLFDQDETQGKLSIVIGFPFVNVVNAHNNGVQTLLNSAYEPTALCVSRLPYIQSCSDNSFIALELTQEYSRDTIVKKCAEMGLSVISVSDYQRANPNVQNSIYCLEVAGYYDLNAVEQCDLANVFENVFVKAEVLGGYPVPPDIIALKNLEQPL